MRRLTIGTFLVGIIGVLAVLGAYSGFFDSAKAAPLAGPQLVAIDAYTGAAQNPANGPLSTVDSCVSIPVGGTATVDVVVDSIPTMTTPNTPTPGEGLGGFGGDILFNGTVIRFINPQSVALMLAADGGYVPFEVVDSNPDADGDHNFNAADLSTNYEDGAGVLARFTIEGLAVGISPLTLDDVAAGSGFLTVADSSSAAYDSFNQQHGQVYVGLPCPQPADTKVTSVTTNAPASANAGVSFPVTVDATVHNNGPFGPVNTDVTVTLNMPADCSAAGGNTVTVQNLSLAVSVAQPIPQQTFTVICTSPSFHDFTATATTVIDDTGFFEAAAANNSMTSAIDTTAVTATADFGITGASTSSTAPVQCLPASPPAPGCASAPVHTIGQNQTVTVTKVLHNNGPYGPVPVQDTVSVIGAVQQPSGNPATCAPMAPQTQAANLAVSTAVTLTFSFTVNCTTDSFANPYPPVGPQQIVILFADTVTSADTHITKAPGKPTTVAPIPYAFWNKAPFNPTFVYTIDNQTGPGEPIVVPASDNCQTNGTAFPGGISCEQLSDTAIPAGNAIGLARISLPQPAFSVSNGLLIANTTPVAYFGFSVGIIGAGCGPGPTVPYPAIALQDGALPAPTAGFDDDGDGFIDEDPPGGGNTDGDGDTDEDGAYVPGLPPEGPNSNLAADLGNPNVFPTRLLADPIVQALAAGGAPLWARYTASVAALGGLPVNILVFNTGTSYTSLTLTGDPVGPSAASTNCTPFTSRTDYLGETSTGTKLRQCNVVGTHTVTAVFTRADTFESTIRNDTVTCSPSNTSVTLTKDEVIGDNNPVGDIINAGITETRTVTVNVIGSGNLTLSLVGPAACNPHWSNPLDAFPSNIGGTQTSVITIPGASGVVNVQYQVTCPVGGPYSLQVIANLQAGPGEDTTDNQDENHIQVIVQCDSDGDGVCTPTDNCPNVANPSQTDTDGDGIGDACDPDDDNDGNPDGTDGCPLIAEDIDGVADADGCPDTDVGVTVVKAENYDVDVSVSTPKSVTITVTNGNYPANVRVVITAISKVGQCEVHLSPIAGFTLSEYYTDEVAGPPNPDTLTSQLEGVIPMAANSSQNIALTYNIHCFQNSLHTNAFELQVDALPLAPVQEENLGDDPQVPPDSPSNNVHKNYPDVIAYNNADLQKSNCTLTSPASVAGGTNFAVTATCTIKNNGPATANYSDSMTLTGPADCTITGNPQVQTGTLTSGQQVNVSGVWTVSCAQPSFHVFTANDTVSITGPLHTKDPDSGNNTGSATSTTAVTTTVDNSVVGTCSAPAAMDVGVKYPAFCSGTINLPNGGTVSLVFVAPSDCTFYVDSDGAGPNPEVAVGNIIAGSTTLPSYSGPLFAPIPPQTWKVSCANPSFHTFTYQVTLTPNYPLHVSESPTGNEQVSGNFTSAVTANGILAVTATVPNAVVFASGPTSQTATVTVSNTGNTVSATSTYTGSTTCTALTGPSPASNGPFTVPPTNVHTGPAIGATPVGNSCTVTLNVSVAATGLHMTGSASTSVTYTICLDVDGDGIGVGGALCGNDNCPTAPNATQTDSDGDGIGDACDSTPTHDVGVKYVILVGPAAVNLSDTNGRYMWVIAEIGNFSNHTELVTINMSIAEAVPPPAGCTRVIAQILPGQNQFVMVAGEQKVIVWRVRYECHSPATAQVITQTVTVSITHDDIDGPGPHSGNDTNLANQSKTTSKQVIIQ